MINHHSLVVAQSLCVPRQQASPKFTARACSCASSLGIQGVLRRNLGESFLALRESVPYYTPFC